MSISIQSKNDYSYLFAGLGSSASNVANSTFLSDYASIKNGSYYKLMKAYYGENSSDTVKKLAGSTTTVANEEAKTNLAKVQSTTDALKESADVLLEKGSKSVFTQKDITTKDENGEEKTTKGYDTDAIYSAVSDFVNKYNSVITAVNDTKDDTTISKAQSMVNNTTANAKLLSRVGITQNEDGTLALDKDTFQKSDMNTVKSLFHGNGSFGYRTSAQASMIQAAADHASSRNTTYLQNGGYSNLYDSGNLFSMYL